jgi:DHA1 family tetracycline resistance protein-like MFS transporter
MQDSETPQLENSLTSVPPCEPAPAGGSRRSALLIDLLGFGIVLPLLPLIGDMYLNNLIPGGKEAKLGGAILGLLMSSFSAMQFLFAPIWGRVSDRAGRRPILLLGLAGSVVFYALFGVASEMDTAHAALAVVLLFVARLGAGVAGATISTAQAVIADSTTPGKRKHGMAMIGAAFGIGFTFGPLIGFAALELFPSHVGSLGFVASALSLIAFVLGLRLLPETRQPGEPGARRQWLSFQGIRNTLRNPTVGLLVIIFFLATFGFGQFEATLALLNKDNLQLSQRNNFLIFAYVGLVLMLIQGFAYRRLARRLHEETFIAMGILLMGLGVAGLGGATWMADQQAGFSQILGTMLGSLAVAVTGFAFLTPSVQALISRRSDPAKQGEVLGVNQSASAMARILGPFVGLTLYKLDPSHLLPYLVGACLILLMLPLLPAIRQKGDQEPLSARSVHPG